MLKNRIEEAVATCYVQKKNGDNVRGDRVPGNQVDIELGYQQYPATLYTTCEAVQQLTR